MRGVAIVAISTLALGIGVTTTMFSVVYAALVRPLPFSESDRLVIIFNTRLTARDGLQQLRWSRPHVLALQQAATSFEAIASSTSTSIAVSGHGDPEQIDGEVVSPAYFSTLRVSPMAGRVFRPDEDSVADAHPVALVSERLWRRRFDADPADGWRHHSHQRRPPDRARNPSGRVCGTERQSGCVVPAGDGGKADIRGLFDHTAAFHHGRGKAEERRHPRAGERGTGGHRRTLRRPGFPTIDHVGRGCCADWPGTH